MTAQYCQIRRILRCPSSQLSLFVSPGGSSSQAYGVALASLPSQLLAARIEKVHRMISRLTRIAVFALLPLFVLGIGSANATLIDRGGGLIYDSALNVTWMQDAQYSITSGFNQFGERTNWQAANDWAAGVQFHDSVRNVTWSNWRLPTTINNSCSLGYDITGLSSELAHVLRGPRLRAGLHARPVRAGADARSNYNPFINLAYRGYSVPQLHRTTPARHGGSTSISDRRN